MYTERFFKGYGGGTRSELRSAGQTNKPFQTKKATSLLCQSHTFKGKLVPSIHLDETQTISNLFQYYSHRNNKAQTEILLRPQNFIKGMKTCSARNPFSFRQDASFVSSPLYGSWLHCQLTRQQRFVSHELQLSRMKSEAWWSLRIFVWVSDHSRSRDDLCCADKKNCGRTEQCGQDTGKTAHGFRAVLQPILLIATVLQWKRI